MRNVEVGHCALRSGQRWCGDLLCTYIIFFSELNFCTKFWFFRVIWNDFSYLGRSRRGAVADYTGRKASFPPRRKPVLKRQRSVIEWLEWQTVCWSSLNDKSFKSDIKAHCRSKQVWDLPPRPPAPPPMFIAWQTSLKPAVLEILHCFPNMSSLLQYKYPC